MPDTGTGKRYSRTRKHKEANCAPGGRRLGPSQNADGRRHNPTQHRSTPLKKRVESDAVAPCRLTPRTDPKRKFLSSSLIIKPRCSQALRSRRCASRAFDSMRVLTRPVPGIVSCILCARSARHGARRNPQPPPRAVRAQCIVYSGICVTCHTYDCCCCCSLAPLGQRSSRGRTGRRLLA